MQKSKLSKVNRITISRRPSLKKEGWTFATYSCTSCCFPTSLLHSSSIISVLVCHQRCYGWLSRSTWSPAWRILRPTPPELGPFTCWVGERDHIFVIRQLIFIFLLMALFLCDIIIISCSRVISLQHSGPSCPPFTWSKIAASTDCKQTVLQGLE